MIVILLIKLILVSLLMNMDVVLITFWGLLYCTLYQSWPNLPNRSRPTMYTCLPDRFILSPYR